MVSCGVGVLCNPMAYAYLSRPIVQYCYGLQCCMESSYSAVLCRPIVAYSVGLWFPMAYVYSSVWCRPIAPHYSSLMWLDVVSYSCPPSSAACGRAYDWR